LQVGGLSTIVVRSVRRRPLRALLTAVAVGLGVTAVLGVQLALVALDDQAGAASAERAGRSSIDVRAPGGVGFDATEVAAAGRIGGVAEVQPFLEKPAVARYDRDAVDAPTVSVVAVVQGEVALRPVHVVAGRLPVEGSLSEVALDQGLTDALRATGAPRALRPGDGLWLTTATGPDHFRVVGLTSGTSGGLAFTQSAVYVSSAEATGAFRLGLRTPLMAVRLRPGVDAAAVAPALQRLLPAAVLIDPRGGGSAPLGGQRSLLALLAILSLVIGAGVTANSVAVGAEERRREIGLLRAAGASMRQVFRLLMAEAAVLALAGAAAGVGGGIALGALLIHHFAAPGLTVPASSAAPSRIAAAVAAGAGAAVLASVLPALTARRVPPIAALRSASTVQRQRTPRWAPGSALALTAVFALAWVWDRADVVVGGMVALLAAMVVALTLAAPLIARGLGRVLAPVAGLAPMAAANLARRRHRTSLTLAGLSVAVASATAVGVLTEGALRGGDQWVSRLFVGDVVLSSPATQPDAIATELAREAGTDPGSRVRYLVASVGGSPAAVAAVDPAAYSSTGALDLVEGDRRTAFATLAAWPSVLVPAQLSARLGWHAGSRLPLLVYGRPAATVTVAGVVAHSLPSADARESLLIGQDQAGQLFGPGADGFDLLQVRAGDDGAARRVAAAASHYGMRSMTVKGLRDAAADAVQHAVGTLAALAWVAISVAMLAVVTTLLVSVRLGRRELALLRAVGLSRRQATRLVLAEAAMLVGIGAGVGVVTGCVLALPLLSVSGSPGFQLPFVFPVLTVAAGLGALVAVAVLAALLPARRSARANIVAAIRHE